MKTAQEYLEEAAQCEKAVQDSWERSDTDGFLSQWANGLGAQKARENARIAEAGGLGFFYGLYEGDRRVAAKQVKVVDAYQGFGRSFKWMWVLEAHEAAKFGRKWVPTGEKSRVQKQLGLAEQGEMAPAEAFVDGSGKGLSGNAWVAIRRTGCPLGSDAKRL